MTTQSNQDELLVAIHAVAEKTGKNPTLDSVHHRELDDWPRDQIFDTAKLLEEQGLIEYVGGPGFVRVLRKGKKRIASLAGPEGTITTTAIEPSSLEVSGPKTTEAVQTAQSHVVLLIHGIRDHALWQNEIKHALQDAGLIPESTNYGRFDLLRFLIPLPYFRNRAVETVWVQIRQARTHHPSAKFSVIAHSFGTYVFAQILKKGFDLKFEYVIFCGSVLSSGFEFEQLSGRYRSPLLNDVGTRDIWPALAESITWGYGSAGTYGFRRPGVEDRWHNKAHHGYFLSAAFCKKFWVPFLVHGHIVRADTDAEAPRLWLRFLSIFRIKYLILGCIAALIFAFMVARSCGSTGTYQLGNDGDHYYFWSGTISALMDDVQDRCTFSWLGDQSFLMRNLAGRRYATIARSEADQLKKIVSCQNFKYNESRRSSDPLQALEQLRERFPACISVNEPHPGNIELLARQASMTQMGLHWLCDCDAERIRDFEAYLKR